MERKPTRTERKEYNLVLELRELLRKIRATRDSLIMMASKEGISPQIEDEIDFCDKRIIAYEKQLKELDK